MKTEYALPAPERGEIAKMLMTLFDHWKLSTEDRLELLGLAPNNRAALTRYRRGEPFAQSRDLLERAGILLGIHKNLRLLFPHNRELAYSWMTTRNRAMGGMTPTEAIKEYGFPGLLMVRAYLDRARGN
jgi:hypothetical protein